MLLEDNNEMANIFSESEYMHTYIHICVYTYMYTCIAITYIRTHIIIFITFQRVHQFTSNSKTIYCYAVKTIKKLKIIHAQCKLRHVSVFSTNHPEEASWNSKTNGIFVMPVCSSLCVVGYAHMYRLVHASHSEGVVKYLWITNIIKI